MPSQVLVDNDTGEILEAVPGMSSQAAVDHDAAETNPPSDPVKEATRQEEVSEATNPSSTQSSYPIICPIVPGAVRHVGR